MRVSEVLDDAKDIFGQCEGARLYGFMTEAIELLANTNPSWDAMTDGVISLNVGKDTENFGEKGLFVLPSFVETPLGLNIDGFPAFPRDRWFQFHINGPGDHSFINGYKSMWDDRGDTPVLACPVDGETITILTDDVTDNGSQVTIFGTDANGAEIYTNGQRGVSFDIGTVSPIGIGQIHEVSKPTSNGTWTMTGTTSGTLLGVYAPSETAPRYKKIKVPASTTVGIRYRRSTVKVEKSSDIIPLNNKLSFLLAMQSVNYFHTRQYDNAKAAKKEAIELANEEQQTRNAQSPIGPQIQDFTFKGGESLWRGGSRSCGGGGVYGS